MIRGIDEPLWKRILYKLWNKLRAFFRKIFYVFVWLPTIWRDENWDHNYMWRIFKRKLEFDRDYYKSADIIVQESYDGIVKEINLAIKLLDRIIAENYDFEACKRIYGSDQWCDIENKDLNRIMELSEKLRHRDFRILNNLLRDKSPGWWD